VRDALEHQMTAPVFPVRLSDVQATLSPREVTPGDAFSVGDVRVRVAGGNHPGGVLAYRLDLGDVSLVYATDTEHGAAVDPELRALAEGATLLIYDAQYTVDEYAGGGGRPARVGWGHSTNVAAAQLARAAGVSALALFHHDPARDDVGVLALEAATRELFPATFAAREGMRLRLDGSGARGPAVQSAREAA
jgi:ribonuclease BN (tRNA processing enzyme)